MKNPSVSSSLPPKLRLKFLTPAAFCICICKAKITCLLPEAWIARHALFSIGLIHLIQATFPHFSCFTSRLCCGMTHFVSLSDRRSNIPAAQFERSYDLTSFAPTVEGAQNIVVLAQKASSKKQRSNGISPLLPGFVPSPRYFRQTYCRTGQVPPPQPAVIGVLPDAPAFM
jgi:hypothetical protein